VVLWRRQPRRRNAPARRAGIPFGLTLGRRPRLESLEDRCVPATLTPGANVNIGRLPDNQAEAAIAINPTNPNNVVAVSNDDGIFSGIRFYRSTDGGTTWTNRVIGAGDSLGVAACCDGQLTFDQFGNLFL